MNNFPLTISGVLAICVLWATPALGEWEHTPLDSGNAHRLHIDEGAPWPLADLKLECFNRNLLLVVVSGSLDRHQARHWLHVENEVGQVLTALLTGRIPVNKRLTLGVTTSGLESAYADWESGCRGLGFDTSNWPCADCDRQGFVEPLPGDEVILWHDL